MKSHAQLTFDYRSLNPFAVFQTVLAVFQTHGFARREFCGLNNWRSLQRAEHFHIRGSLFREISFSPIANHRLDLMCINADAPFADLNQIIAALVMRLSAKQAFLHSADYYHWQNAQQPMEYEFGGKDHSALPKVNNGLPPPLEEMWIDISRNAGRRYLRAGFQEAVSSPMWLRHDQLNEAQVAKIRSHSGFEIDSYDTHYCIRHSHSPFGESTATEQEFLRAACFGRMA